MIILISGIIAFLTGLYGLIFGFITANFMMLIAGGFISLIGIVLLSTFFIISYIEAMDNRNVSGNNEIISGLGT